MSTPLVSIIIPTYNRAGLILETLESVKNQTYTHWECIIVDDGSTDNTTEVVHNYIQSDNRFQFHKRPHFHKPGGNGARNYGFTLAKGEYVNWFDSDDLMIESFIEAHLQNFFNHPNIDISSCFADIFHKYKENIVEKLYPKIWEGKALKPLIVGKIFFLTPCNLWKRKSLESRVLFNESLFRSQEADFNFRRFTEGFQYRFLPIPLVLVRRGHDSIDSQFKKDIRKINSQFTYYNNVFLWMLQEDKAGIFSSEMLHVFYKQLKILYHIKNKLANEKDVLDQMYFKINNNIYNSHLTYRNKISMIFKLKFIYYTGKGYKFVAYK